MSQHVSALAEEPTASAEPSLADVAAGKVDTSDVAADDTLILGKFKTQDDLVKAYTELEQKLGTPAPKAEDKPAEGDKPDAADANAAPADFLAGHGLSLDALTQEFQTAGALSDDTYAKLQAAGVSREAADTYIAGRQAQVAAETQDILSAAEGQESYNEMLEWASSNLSQQEAEAYNNTINTGKAADAKSAVAALYAKYRQASPKAPKLIEGSTSGTGETIEPFSTPEEMADAQGSPRYKIDAKYRALVAKRIMKSKFF